MDLHEITRRARGQSQARARDGKRTDEEPSPAIGLPAAMDRDARLHCGKRLGREA
jgi:hypothetical protein